MKQPAEPSEITDRAPFSVVNVPGPHSGRRGHDVFHKLFERLKFLGAFGKHAGVGELEQPSGLMGEGHETMDAAGADQLMKRIRGLLQIALVDGRGDEVRASRQAADELLAGGGKALIDRGWGGVLAWGLMGAWRIVRRAL